MALEIGKVLEHGIALLRGNIKGIALKIAHPKAFGFHNSLRMFIRTTLLIRAGGEILVGKGVTIGRNSSVRAQGGKIIIEDGVGINQNVMINAHEGVKVGEGTVIAPNVCIYDHDHLFSLEKGVDKKHFKTAPVTIGRNVWIGANAVILRGTTIGDGSVVGAGAVLKGDYPARSVIVSERNVRCIPLEKK